MRSWVSSLPIGWLLLLPALLVLVFGIAVWSVSLAGDWKGALDQGYARSRTLADVIASDIQNVLRDYEAVLEALVQRPGVRALDEANCDPVLGETASLHVLLTSLTIRDLNGGLICSSSATALERLPEDQVVLLQEGARQPGLYVTNAIRGASSGRWIAATTYPIRNAAGSVVAMILAPLDLAMLNERIFGDYAPNILPSVLGTDDRVVLRSQGFDEWVGNPLPARITDLFAGSEGYFRAVDLAGNARIGAYVTMERSGWTVALGYLEAEALAPIGGP